MIRSRKRVYLILVAVLVLLVFSCKRDEEIISPALIYSGPWGKGWPQLGHNGMPYESDRFIGYTNYAEQQDIVETSGHAESIMDEIIAYFDVQWDNYQFVPEQSNRKIAIFSDYEQLTSNGGLAFRDGIIIRALNSPLYFQNLTFTQWKRTLKHELTHVNEFLLIGDPKYQQANTVWFREGIATFVSGRKTIVSISQLNSWRDQQKNVIGEGNPIAVNSFSDLPSNDPNTVGAYYSFFELSVRYLLDSSGNGSEISDVKSFYSDLGNGHEVGFAFANNFEMTLQEFQDQYWDLMTEYLK